MAGNESQVLAAELEHVESKIPILFDRDDTFYSRLEKVPGEMVSSISARIPLEIRPGGKPGYYSSDGGDMGRGDMPTYDKATITYSEIKHALEWTTRRKWGVNNSRKAVIDAFRRDIASAMKEFRRYNESQCMTAGNAVMGTITSATTAGGVDTYTLTTDGFGAKLLRYGQNINVYNSTLTTNRTSGGETSISFLDLANKQIQCSAVTNVTGGDLIVASGQTATPPVGLLGVFYHASNASTGSWLGFNRATTPEIRANRVAAGGTLTLPMPRLAINKIGDRIGIAELGRKLDAWMHPCQQQAYEELGFEALRIDKSARDEGLDLYFNDNMRMAGAPVRKSYLWDRTRIDFVDYSVYKRIEFVTPQWYKDDNGLRYFVVRAASGGVQTSNLAYLVVGWNMFVNNPGGVSYIDTLTVPSGY